MPGIGANAGVDWNTAGPMGPGNSSPGIRSRTGTTAIGNAPGAGRGGSRRTTLGR
jgi:hypothetical protein